MLFYSRATRIQPLTLVRRERFLAGSGEVTVSHSQELSPVQVVAKAPRRNQYVVIPACERLGISTQQLEKGLKVAEGEIVREGMPLAQKPGLLGRRKMIRAPVNGTLIQIKNGRLIIQKPSATLELRALMSGKVATIFPDKGVVIETPGALVDAVWDSGKEGIGYLHIGVDSPEGTLQSDDISIELRSKVLIAGRVNSADALRKAEENGIRGVVAGSMPAALIPTATKLSIPLFLTESIGNVPMSTPIFDLLVQLQGNLISLLSQSKAAPGRRPALIIPLESDKLPEESQIEDMEIKIGQQVRLLRNPNQGAIGVIKQVYQHGKTTDAGIRMPGADVQLADNTRLFVPHTNLDRIV